ncbi:SAM-dependent methyltransferase [Microseira wollei]|uniref:Cyclopropane-fatty-acyl-phospholipid synthase n=1 Tax=Microseira wollei NIES-4236 TaxID=2530354 RepID=A0AAV3XJW7_9CYAN|nr:cyclopropane-fatty-acyl-phospholipid synthase family protein [Microseira wollei]GET40859.1 putative cyclopropane-fatty-acyl-phospholipid synthase [Microseira wollei NIES-4236]
MDFVIGLEKIERGEVSDRAIRNIIRYGLAKILAEKDKDDVSTQCNKLLEFVGSLKESPIAVNTADANQQHYEVPAEFFQLVLGKRLKYSACYWPEGVSSLDEAEEAMLQLICDRAQIADGQEILDLGCGWGSLSLYLAEKYPNSKITGLSNSSTQKEFIDSQKDLHGLKNLNIITGDISQFDTSATFDRIVSIEMFEHIRNYEQLLAKVASWIKPDGLLFVHIFTHLKYAYYFENNWTAEYFFTGGIMPSDNLLLYFAKDIWIKNHWRVSGVHYQKTSDAWLENQDQNRGKILDLFSKTYSTEKALKMFVMWRLFFMTCSESFGYKSGQEWMVSHYLFEKNK